MLHAHTYSRPHSMPCSSTLEYPGVVSGAMNHVTRYNLLSPRPVNKVNAVAGTTDRFQIGSPRSYSALARTGRALMSSHHERGQRVPEAFESASGSSLVVEGESDDGPRNVSSSSSRSRGGHGTGSRQYYANQTREDDSYGDLDLSKFGL